jgi:mono/diheme cytochrome c family protein
MRNTGRIQGVALGVIGTLLVAGAAGAIYIATGSADVAADEPHAPAVARLLESARGYAIHDRTGAIVVPAGLDDPARVLQGAGNYDAMCAQCHLAPGMAPTELSRGLNPSPPNLTREPVNEAETFWVVKHGIKMTGMPAWGESMADEYIWNLAAFVKHLPTLDEAGYRDLVARSGGHSHGGGESGGHGHGASGGTGDHPHPPGTPADHHGPAPAATSVHMHDDGSAHEHTAPVAKPVPAARPVTGAGVDAPQPDVATEAADSAPAAHDHTDHDH